jgi:hypothetical protein
VPQNASQVALGTLGLAVLVAAFLWHWMAYYMSAVQFTAAKSVAAVTGVRKYAIAYVGTDGRYTLAGYAVFTEGWWLAKLTVALVSVPAPSLAGLLLARAVAVGWNPRTVLIVVSLILIIPALYNYNWRSLLLLVSLALVLALFIFRSNHSAQRAVVIALAWFFLVGGVGWVLAHAARPSSVDNTAVDALEDLTGIPDEIWTAIFLFISIATLVTGAHWLLR